MDNGEIYGLENVSILALFRCIQNIANTFHLVYLNNLPDLYIILLEIFPLSTILLTQV
jgi:hypothetical protein